MHERQTVGQSTRYAFWQDIPSLPLTNKNKSPSIINGEISSIEKYKSRDNQRRLKKISRNIQYNICENSETAIDLNVKNDRDIFYFSASCTNDKHTSSYTNHFVVNVDNFIIGNKNIKNMRNLFYPELEGQQDISPSLYGKWFYFTLSSIKRCQSLRANPIKNPPIPDYAVDRNGQWHMAFNFIANDDCDVMIIHVANRFIVINPNENNLRARIYDVVFVRSGER